MVNDIYPLTGKLFGSCCAYVMQDDILFESFTAKEAVTFAARLKLNCSGEMQDHKVEQLLKQLSLERCQDTVIGNTSRKTISGGERKRCSIGVELIADPSVILLDEPTSGLDSFMAKQICKLMQNLAHEQGKTVIATIHQPSSEAFSYFDRLLLMSDGNIVFQGLANQSPAYFKSIGFALGKFANPADSFMKVLSVNYPKLKADEEKLETLVRSYNLELSKLVLKEMK